MILQDFLFFDKNRCSMAKGNTARSPKASKVNNGTLIMLNIIDKSIQQTAQRIMSELDACRFTIKHGPTLKKGIMEIAEACGTKLQPPKAYANGELSLFTAPDDDGFCIHYGETFATLLNQFRCRTGQQIYGYNAKMLPCNGWCYMPYWDVEALIKKVAE